MRHVHRSNPMPNSKADIANAKSKATNQRLPRDDTTRQFQHSFLCYCQACLFCLPSSKWYVKKCKVEMMNPVDDIDSLSSPSKSTKRHLPQTPSTRTSGTTKSASASRPSARENIRDPAGPLLTPQTHHPPSLLRLLDAEKGLVAASLSPLTPSSHPLFPSSPNSSVLYHEELTGTPTDLTRLVETNAVVTPVSDSHASSVASSSCRESSSSGSQDSANRPSRSLFEYIMEGSSGDEDDEPIDTLLLDVTPKRKNVRTKRENQTEDDPTPEERKRTRPQPLQLPPLLPSNLDYAQDSSTSSSFRSTIEYFMEESAAERDSSSAVCSEDVAYWYQRPSPTSLDGNTAPLRTVSVTDIQSGMADTERVSPISDTPVEQSSSSSDSHPHSDSSNEMHLGSSLIAGRFASEELDAQSSSSDDAIASSNDSVNSEIRAIIIPDVDQESLTDSEHTRDAAQLPPLLPQANFKQGPCLLLGIILVSTIIIMLVPGPLQLVYKSPARLGSTGDTLSHLPEQLGHDIDLNRTTAVDSNQTAFPLEENLPPNITSSPPMTTEIAETCPCCGDETPKETSSKLLSTQEFHSVLTQGMTASDPTTDASTAIVQQAYHWWWTPSFEWESATRRRKSASFHQSRSKQRQQQQRAVMMILHLPKFVIRWHQKFQCIARCLAQ